MKYENIVKVIVDALANHIKENKRLQGEINNSKNQLLDKENAMDCLVEEFAYYINELVSLKSYKYSNVFLSYVSVNNYNPDNFQEAVASALSQEWHTECIITKVDLQSQE